MWAVSLSGSELLPLAGILSCTSEKVFLSAFLLMVGFKSENILKGGDAPPTKLREIFHVWFQVPS